MRDNKATPLTLMQKTVGLVPEKSSAPTPTYAIISLPTMFKNAATEILIVH